MIPLDDVSTRIFGIVQSKGLEQKKFAELVGVTDKTVNNWKMGRSESYTKYIRKIAKVLDTTTEYLLTGDSPKQGNASYVSELDTLTEDALDVARAYHQADDRSRAMVRLALGMDDNMAIAARGGRVVKKPSPASAEALDRLSRATQQAADQENDQY